jgi:hypothetical protein
LLQGGAGYQFTFEIVSFRIPHRAALSNRISLAHCIGAQQKGVRA